jgi:hypothetical protein
VKDLELINVGNLCVLHRQLIGQKLGLADHLVMLLQVMQQYIVLCAVHCAIVDTADGVHVSVIVRVW